MRQLEVRVLHRDGLLKSGAAGILCWRVRGEVVASISVATSPAGDLVTLRYRTTPAGGPGRDVVDQIQIERTACNFGGDRPWFRCPDCGRRAAILYGGTVFRCRGCCELVYASQREDELLRALSRAQDIRIRLGGTGDMFSLFPERPKGMHRSTYERVRERHDQAAERLSRLMAAELGWER
jgi:hypothetical protein